jgi:isocitrate dehydrogenase kinase/phosphatase
VNSHGGVIFYDYDELCRVTDCVFRDLPTACSDEEETSAEPWFYVGPNDVFPEQWLPFLAMPDALREVFVRHQGELLTAAWWNGRRAALLNGLPPEASAGSAGVSSQRALAMTGN